MNHTNKPIASQILSDITAYMKYARYLPSEQRRETWDETVSRNKMMHIKKFPELKTQIDNAYEYVYNKKLLPSMRALQFAGTPIELNPSRLYNCSGLHIDHPDAFSETMFLLLSGAGVGYSVQRHHIRKLPPVLGVQRPEGRQRKKRYLIGDSIEGWSDAIKVLVESYFYNKREIDFDFRDIRQKGALLLTSGGKAPGPEPLRNCLTQITSIFENAIATRGHATQLKPIEAHDIQCFIADAVLSGGIRRSAMICLFSLEDTEMLECKFGNWYESNPQRALANNSVMLLRSQLDRPTFNSLWEKIEASGSGEPGIFLSNSEEWIVNPCFTGDMELLTSTGYKTFEELDGKQAYLVGKGNKTISLGKVWLSGYKNTIKLKLSNKEIITCTPDHPFLVNDEWVKAENLKGKRLTEDTTEFRPHIYPYEQYGFLQGDGCLGRLKSKDHQGLEVNLGKKDLEIFKLFNVEKVENKRAYYINGFNGDLNKHGFSSESLPDRVFPSSFYDSLVFTGEKASFLRGMYSANGCVIKHHRVAYKTTCRSLADSLVEALKADFDIDSYVTTNKTKKVMFANGEYQCRESYDINITRALSVRLFHKYIGFLQVYKNTDLKSLVLEKAVMVRSIQDNGMQKVYDFSEPSTNAGWVNGVQVHNCGEVSLRSCQMCNLAEINFSNIESQEDLNTRSRHASFIATLQASYTDFHYLRDIWRDTTEKEALIGVSLTGVATEKLYEYDLKQASKIVKKENARVAKLIGINPSSRSCVVKPSGTASIVLGTSSGVHAWYDEYYWRRIRVNKNEAIYNYLSIIHPELIEDDFFKPETTAIIKVPQKAPEGSILRSESPIDTLERVRYLHTNWIAPAHKKGINKNNVSCTIQVKPNEWSLVGDWMWENREHYNGIAVLPYDSGTYKQAPFETCTKLEYEEAMKHLTQVDLKHVVEDQDNTDLKGELACGGGASCEVV